jgi:hypothetical protein
MMLKKNGFLDTPKLLLMFGLLLVQTLVFSQNKTIEFSNDSDRISLYHNSQIAYSNVKEITPENVSNLHYKTFNSHFQKQSPVPDSSEYAVIRFSVHNNENEALKIYLTTKEDIAIAKVFEKKGTDYQFISGIGYANKVSEYPLYKNEHQLVLNLEKNATTQFLIHLKKYKYTLVIPEIELLSETGYFKNIEEKQNSKFNFYHFFTNLIAGFQLALLLFGIFKIYLYGFKKIYVFFSLLCLLFILFYLNETHVLIFETSVFPNMTNKMVYEVLGDSFIVVFNFLIISFFDLDKKEFLYKFLVGISAFWVLLFFVEAIPFINHFVVIKTFRFILNIAAIIDFITLSFIFY